MSNCEKYLDLISAYFDGELDINEKAELEAHLTQCEDCRSVLETYRAISSEMALDTEEVPAGFSDGVMEKVASYEKNINARARRRNLGIAGRWIGIAACIAIVLVAFPRMPGLGCGASADSAVMESADAVMDIGAAFTDTNTSGAEPEASVDYSYSDGADYDIFADAEETDDTAAATTENGSAKMDADIGMVVTVYGADVPDALINSEYSVTYYKNGDIEYLVPVSAAREIISQLDNAEVEELDTDIENMMARIIFTK